MAKKNSFENNIIEIDKIIEELENGNLSLEDAIKYYEKGMSHIKNATDILNEAKGKIYEVSNNSEIKILEVEKNGDSELS